MTDRQANVRKPTNPQESERLAAAAALVLVSSGRGRRPPPAGEDSSRGCDESLWSDGIATS